MVVEQHSLKELFGELNGFEDSQDADGRGDKGDENGKRHIENSHDDEDHLEKSFNCVKGIDGVTVLDHQS